MHLPHQDLHIQEVSKEMQKESILDVVCARCCSVFQETELSLLAHLVHFCRQKIHHQFHD